jgi:hypothetical protein
MAFWMGILVGGIFAWLAIKLGFYQTWALVFNIIISIYLGLYLQPAITNISAVGDTPFSNALSMLAIAVAAFLILQGISYTFITGQFNISFPKVFETLGSGFLGFLAGYLVWSFIALFIYITPISQSTFVKEAGFKDELQQSSVSYISRFCNMVNAIVSRNKESSAEQTINRLLKSGESKEQEKTPEKPEPVKPVKKPGDIKAGVTDQNQPGPPPELEGI